MSEDWPSAGTLLAARYRLVELLETGGMAEIWRADDELLGRPVAVKLPTGPQVAWREARMAARLSHPGIAAVHDYREAVRPDGSVAPCVVMELLAGETVAARIERGPIALPEAARIGAAVADALAAAHASGVVHRDVKPGNVMLTPTGVKILDFGISAPAGEPDDDDSGATFGTPAYVAPERLDGKPAEPATDVYGLGVLLFEMVTGEPPYPVDTWEELAEAREVGPGRLPDSLPADFRTVVERCLDEQPENRPDADEVRYDLTAQWLAATADSSSAASAATPTAASPSVRDEAPVPWPVSLPGGRRTIFTGPQPTIAAPVSPGAAGAVATAPPPAAAPVRERRVVPDERLGGAGEQPRLSGDRPGMVGERPRTTDEQERIADEQTRMGAGRAAVVDEQTHTARARADTSDEQTRIAPARPADTGEQTRIAGGRPGNTGEQTRIGGHGPRTSIEGLVVVPVVVPSRPSEPAAAPAPAPPAPAPRRRLVGLIAMGLVLATAGVFAAIYWPRSSKEQAAPQPTPSRSLFAQLPPPASALATRPPTARASKPSVTPTSPAATPTTPPATPTTPAVAPTTPAATSAPSAAPTTVTLVGFPESIESLRLAVSEGADADEIRPDVATDLLNVVRNLGRTDPDEIARPLEQTRQKVRQRAGEGTVSADRADILLARLADVEAAAAMA